MICNHMFYSMGINVCQKNDSQFCECSIISSLMDHITRESDLRHTIYILKDLLEDLHYDDVNEYLQKKGICPSCYMRMCECLSEESESDSDSDSDTDTTPSKSGIAGSANERLNK